MFTVAGISKNKGKVKVRFCSDMVLRIKNLQKQGDTDIHLVELPQPLDKWHACEYLLNSGLFTEFADEIVEIQGKKVTGVKTPKISIKPVVEDKELQAIKELAA